MVLQAQVRLFAAGLCTATFVMVALTAPISAAPSATDTEPDKPNNIYTIFDLANNEGVTVLHIGKSSPITSGGVFQDNNALMCNVESDGNDRLVIRKSTSCSLFRQQSPDNFYVLPKKSTAINCTSSTAFLPECAKYIYVEFGKVIPIAAMYNDEALRFKTTTGTSKSGCAAYFTDSQWIAKPVTLTADPRDTSVTLLSSLKLPTESGTVFLRAGDCITSSDPSVFKLSYGPRKAPGNVKFPPEDCKGSPARCMKVLPAKGDTYPNADDGWSLFIDQANAQSIPRITYNPNNYINPDSFGRIRIRHWKDVVPIASTGGAAVSLTAPTFEGGVATTESSATLGASLDRTDNDAFESTILIPPHTPGTVHLSVKFQDANEPTKPKSEIGVDLLVDKGYSGALRFGISHVFGAEDHTFSAFKRTDNSASEIILNASSANEIVVGYALYLDGFDVGGRRYFLIDNGPWAFFKRHVGVYAGFGALTYSPGNLDFLKSIHLGVEFEFSRNISVAATFVGRRVSKLAGGLSVGGEAPAGSIPTEIGYAPGFGLVLNLSLDF